MHKPLNPADPDQEAHFKRDIKFLMIQHLTFRAYIKFSDRKTVHLYGNEHQCTYNQLLRGKLPDIKLDREKGYVDLVNYIEKTIAGRYTTAAIYMRSETTKEFDILCRQYYKNEVQQINDPVIDESNRYRTLWYYIKNGRVIIDTTDPSTLNLKTEL